MQATLEHHFEQGRLFLFPTGEWVIAEARALAAEGVEVTLLWVWAARIAAPTRAPRSETT